MGTCQRVFCLFSSQTFYIESEFNKQFLHHLPFLILNFESTVPVITVGIFAEPEIHFSLDGSFDTSLPIGTLSGKYTAKISEGRFVLERKDTVQIVDAEIILHPTNAECSFILNDVMIGVQFHWQRKEDQRFVGGLKLTRTGDTITAINVVSIEEYLKSVISSEMSADCSMQLLKAHAITSRSWLLAQLEKSRELKSEKKEYQSLFESPTERIRWYDREDHELFDVCADDHCQRYQGVTKAYTGSVEQAVKDTRGDVVIHGGKVCDARFSKSCGGVTETFENVWEPVRFPYLESVVDTPAEKTTFNLDFSKEESVVHWIRSGPDAFCNTTDKKILSQVLLKYDQETTDFFRWRVEYTQAEIAELIRRKSGIDFGEIVDLIPVERGKSSRLIRLKIVGSKKTFTLGKELEIRRTLSPSHLYSSAFIVEKLDVVNGLPGRFVLHGAGWGHGVGLCQIGAAVMGEKGYSHDKILAHYFRNTEIKKIY